MATTHDKRSSLANGDRIDDQEPTVRVPRAVGWSWTSWKLASASYQGWSQTGSRWRQWLTLQLKQSPPSITTMNGYAERNRVLQQTRQPYLGPLDGSGRN